TYIIITYIIITYIIITYIIITYIIITYTIITYIIITYIITWPPLADSVEPVISPASSEARNTTQRAISSGSPRRPRGIRGRTFFSSTSFGIALTISVAI